MPNPLASLANATLLLTLAASLPSNLSAQTAPSGSIRILDKAGLQAHFKAMGYQKRGGIGHDKTDSPDPRYRGLTHFSSSFSVGGVSYPYTMLGYPPASGQTASLRSVIVPLRMQFSGFGPNHDIAVNFDPRTAVANIVGSPIYQKAAFPNGFGQFGDLLQRATFWNKMDKQHQWHVLMTAPRIAPTVNIEVTPETGTLSQSAGTSYFGDVLIDFMDSQIQTILQLTPIDADEVPIFVTQNVTAEALGYHSANAVSNGDDSETMQTYIYTSWLDPALVDPLFADVSTINHEEGEWLNDPFVNNVVPTWAYPPATDPRSTCSHNPFLEVGDPQGNGPTYNDFPTHVATVNGTPYHLQQLVLLQWFADEVPSSAYNGWYTFPIPTSLTVPAVYCQ